MSRAEFVTPSAIEAARERIGGVIRATPLEPSPSLSEIAGAPVFAKLEHHQHTGSFKYRGASNAVAQLSEAERAAGVAGVSTGNHGRGLARACKRAGVRCRIAMSELVPANKVEAIRAEGAEIVIEGRSQDEAEAAVERAVAAGMTTIPPFDDPRVIAGQGTLGLELAEQLPEIACALVQLSGGGLISGVAAALKARNPKVRVIGVSMERGAAMKASLDAGRPVEVEELPTLADSLGGGVGLDNRWTFEMVKALVDEVVTVSEIEIARAIRHLYWRERQIVEGSGSVGVAALLAGKVAPNGPCAVLTTGCNIDMTLHYRIIGGEDVDVAKEAA